jgi:transcriptional regulator with XRE-family HTH domain
MISTPEQASAPIASTPPDELSKGITTRAQRVCRGLRPTQVAMLTGVPRESVRRYLAGTHAPTGAFIAALCQGLGVSPAWLLLGEGEPFIRPPAPLPGATKDALRAAVAQLALRIEHLP